MWLEELNYQVSIARQKILCIWLTAVSDKFFRVPKVDTLVLSAQIDRRAIDSPLFTGLVGIQDLNILPFWQEWEVIVRYNAALKYADICETKLLNDICMVLEESSHDGHMLLTKV